MEYIIDSVEQMQNVADAIVKIIGDNKQNTHVLALHGDLGAGKTTFTKALAERLGIKEIVTSPTFVIQKKYIIPETKAKEVGINTLIHIDAYRLKSGKEMEALDFSDTVSNIGNLIVIEWAENVQDAISSNSIEIQFEYIDENTRKVTLGGTIMS